MKKEVIKNKRWWFEQAKNEGYEWANKAIKNLIGYDDIEVESLSYALRCAFVWGASLEGRKYWREIHKELQSKGL